MGRQRTSSIERFLQRIEERIEEWRGEHRERFVEVEASRSELWAEAVEREKLLAEAIGHGEAAGIPVESTSRQAPAVYVVHSGEASQRLENLVAAGGRLASVIPGGQDHARESGLEGSWLVFEVEDDLVEEPVE
ncbi:MAG: hypothetical protein WA990_08040 [Rubrobacteraceae bacterium]